MHQSVDAVGICSACGQGVCDSCAVKIGGKLYCKEDADKVFGGQEESEIEPTGRVMPNTVNSVMFVLYGIFGLGLGLVAIVAGVALGGISMIPGIGSLGLASIGVFTIGSVFVLMGGLGVIAGYWFWKSDVHGGMLGAPLLVVGAVVVLFLTAVTPSLPSFEVGILFFGTNVIMLILVIWGWRGLE